MVNHRFRFRSTVKSFDMHNRKSRWTTLATNIRTVSCSGTVGRVSPNIVCWPFNPSSNRITKCTNIRLFICDYMIFQSRCSLCIPYQTSFGNFGSTIVKDFCRSNLSGIIHCFQGNSSQSWNNRSSHNGIYFAIGCS